MTMLAVHPWPSLTPVAQDGIFVISVRTKGALPTAIQRTAARANIRQAAREALAAVLQLPASAIDIESTPGHAPRILLTKTRQHTIHCSFAHDGDYSLAAINLHGPIGVDVTRIQDIPDWQAVARDYLGPTVSAALLAMPASDRPPAFAEAWTRREATLKCQGKPLSEWQPADATASIELFIPAPGLIGHVAIGEKQ